MREIQLRLAAKAWLEQASRRLAESWPFRTIGPCSTVAFRPKRSSSFSSGLPSGLVTPFSSLGLGVGNPDITPTFEFCRVGGLIDGEVRYAPEPLDPPPDGNVLLCCSTPLSATELDL